MKRLLCICSVLFCLCTLSALLTGGALWLFIVHVLCVFLLLSALLLHGKFIFALVLLLVSVCAFALGYLFHLPKIERARSFDSEVTAVTANVTNVTKGEYNTILIVKNRELGNISLAIPTRENEFIDIGSEISFTAELEYYNSIYSMGKQCFLSGFASDYRIFEPKGGLEKAVYEVRGFVRRATARTDNPELANALLIGDRNGIDAEVNEAFAKIGTSHIISLSGLHLTILIMSLYNLFSNKVTPEWALVIFPLTAFLYSAVAGFPLSLIRSAFMMSVFFVSKVFKRETDSLTSLCFAVFAVALVNPFSLFDVSFLLSVFATLGIVTLGDRAVKVHDDSFWSKMKVFDYKKTKRHYRFLKVLSPICVTLSATAVTMPVIIPAFNRFSSVAILGNLLTVPFGELYLLVTSLFVAVEATGINFLAVPFRLASELLGKIFMELTLYLASISSECISVNKLYLSVGIPAMSCLVLILVMSYRKKAALLVLTVLMSAFIPFYNSVSEKLSFDLAVIESFDTHGDAVYLEHCGKSFYFDQSSEDTATISTPSSFNELNGKIHVDAAVFISPEAIPIERIGAFLDIYSADEIVLLTYAYDSLTEISQMCKSAGADFKAVRSEHYSVFDGVSAHMYIGIATAFTVEVGDESYCDYHSYSDFYYMSQASECDFVTFSGVRGSFPLKISELDEFVIG